MRDRAPRTSDLVQGVVLVSLLVAGAVVKRTGVERTASTVVTTSTAPRSLPAATASPELRMGTMTTMSFALAGLPDAALATPGLVDRLGEALLETARLPSLSIAILRDGEVTYARAFGYADTERRIGATPSTQYRCASVSKTITATAIGRLVQSGRLDLDAPVSGYVSAWPVEPPITARQLAGHLAGVAHYQGDDRIDRRRHYETVTESIDIFRDSPRAGDPGAAYTYSTHGFTLLSAVAEGASGVPFLDLLEDELFEPFGMEGSGPDLRAAQPETMSTLYARRRGEPFPIPRPEDPSYKWAGGGLISTPTDLVRMADVYLDGTLDPETVEEMWTPQRTDDGESTGVGIAWRIGEDDEGRRVIHHSGSMGGARSTLVIWPDRREAIAVMTNVTWSSNIMETGLLLMEAYRAGAPGGAPTISSTYSGEFTRAGETTPAVGDLSLEDGDGWISTPAPFGEWTAAMTVERMPVHALGGDRFALVSPYGLMPVELTRDGVGWSGTMELGSTVWRFQSEAGGSR